MKLHNSFATALNGLKTNKSRSALTTLGIIIGITAIIMVMSVSQGATDLILSQLQGLGSQTVIVRAGQEPKGPSDFSSIFTQSLKDREVTAIRNPALVRGAESVAPCVYGAATMLYKNETKQATLLGTTPELLEILNIQPQDGTFFSELDLKGLSNSVVIGSDIKDKLFGDSTAVGQTVKINNRNFRVIGVFGPIGQIGSLDINTQIMVPATTVHKYLTGTSHYTFLLVKAQSEEIAERMADDIRMTLRELHNITDPDKDDFFVATQADIAKRVSQITSILAALLVAVAAISLIVGGIGIMNIMLVSVTERTREIGLRKAVGATSKDILHQFLLESIILTVFGGAAGIACGAFFSLLIAIGLSTALAIDWNFAFPVSAALLGVTVAGTVGLVFGLYPARQAAKKEPIEALRYE